MEIEKMRRSVFKELAVVILTLAALWLGLLIIPFAERILLGARTYYGLYTGDITPATVQG
jgi:hypothetical protein